MKTKKILSMLLVFSMLFGLTACGGKSNTEEKVKKDVNILITNKDADGINSYLTENAEEKESVVTTLKQQIDSEYTKYVNEETTEEQYKEFTHFVANVDAVKSYYYEVNKNYSSIRSSKMSYKSGIEALNKKDYESAITYLSKVSKEDTKNYTDAQNKLTSAKKIFVKRCKAAAVRYAKKRNYAAAVRKLNQVKKYDKSVNKLLNRYRKRGVKRILKDAKKAAKKRQYSKAEAYTRKAISRFGNSPGLRKVLKRYRKNGRKYLLNLAKGCAARGDYTKAISYLNKLGKKYGSTPKLRKMKKRYRKLR
ncbi:MAG: hypothetical protein K6F77_05655, partial [Lachnospiraceae bacterium]|nr:hypothetical protein [Lachnospiraceae bacterium]